MRGYPSLILCFVRYIDRPVAAAVGAQSNILVHKAIRTYKLSM